MTDETQEQIKVINIHEQTCDNCGFVKTKLFYHWGCGLGVEGASGEWIVYEYTHSGDAKPDPRDLTCPQWKPLLQAEDTTS